MINAIVQDHQAYHQSAIVEIEHTISNQNISILIDPGDTLIYITPKMMEKFQHANTRNSKPWLDRLATRAKIKVTDFIADCEIKIQDHETKINLNVLPLGSYDMIINMEWL